MLASSTLAGQLLDPAWQSKCQRITKMHRSPVVLQPRGSNNWISTTTERRMGIGTGNALLVAAKR
jgi:hypothetical protein